MGCPRTCVTALFDFSLLTLLLLQSWGCQVERAVKLQAKPTRQTRQRGEEAAMGLAVPTGAGPVLGVDQLTARSPLCQSSPLWLEPMCQSRVRPFSTAQSENRPMCQTFAEESFLSVNDRYTLFHVQDKVL